MLDIPYPDSLTAVHHPDSIRIVRSGTVAVLATDCTSHGAIQ
jgi:hypothetical protein